MIARIVRLPVVLFLLAITVASIIHARFPIPLGMPSFAVAMTAGGILLLAAVAIAGAALAAMKKHRTTVEPWQRPSSLVTGSVFAFTRNPIYLSLLLIVLGLALMADAFWFVVAAAVLWLVLDRVVIRSEERIVEEAFADQYVAYKNRVRRWL
ncbi:MAG TPA: methyltransferase [Thermoanaerobaculia bacterium]|nr:methyltransferase [Thermoanaerobaculia bacterium]